MEKSTRADRPTAPVARDAVLLETRIVSIILIPILTLAFLVLYLNPNDTGRHFAWAIHPPMTAMLMGAGYIAGAYYFVRMAVSRHWHHLGRTLPAVSVFALVMAIATILHWSLFNHSKPIFYLWVVVYAVAPPLVLYLWLRNRGQDSGAPDPDDQQVHSTIRLCLGIVGVGALILAAGLLFRPSSALGIWAWKLSPLTARVLSGWLSLAGAASILLAGEARWSAWRISIQATSICAVLVAIGILRDWSDFHTDRLMTWMFVLTVAVWLLGFVGLYVEMERRSSIVVPMTDPG